MIVHYVDRNMPLNKIDVKIEKVLFFLGLHPVASITTISGGAVNRYSIFSNVVFITISYPLHVSAPTVHLQVKYVLVNS
jgi:hypothetical protein